MHWSTDNGFRSNSTGQLMSREMLNSLRTLVMTTVELLRKRNQCRPVALSSGDDLLSIDHCNTSRFLQVRLIPRRFYASASFVIPHSLIIKFLRGSVVCLQDRRISLSVSKRFIT